MRGLIASVPLLLTLSPWIVVGVVSSRKVDDRKKKKYTIYSHRGLQELRASIKAPPDDSASYYRKRPAWSASKYPGLNNLKTMSQDDELGNEWAQRGLGEHASVPSFASFAIALMSNDAPPSLVQDALKAGITEVKHAKVAFEAASLLLGRQTEPGPIPATSHTYGQDLESLVFTVAQDGCIHETLSALLTAFDVDSRIDSIDHIDGDTKDILKEKLSTMALEETKHAGLAWRTVHWVCDQDQALCALLREKVFDPAKLQEAFEQTFGRHAQDETAKEAWERVHSTLVPISVSSFANAGSFGCERDPSASSRFFGYGLEGDEEDGGYGRRRGRYLEDGSYEEMSATVDDEPLQTQMANQIIYEALCPSSFP